MNNPSFAHQETSNYITKLQGDRQNGEKTKDKLTADMRALYNYVLTLYYPNQPTQNLVAGTSGQGQHGQWHFGQGQHVQVHHPQGYYGQGQHVQVQHEQVQHEQGQPRQSHRGQVRRVRGRRDGGHGAGPSN
uniref:Uncharacterized protein n=1 Tax=Meloidogyne incognita TaxID=6306 RepID=A0A914MTS6_MELIC